MNFQEKYVLPLPIWCHSALLCSCFITSWWCKAYCQRGFLLKAVARKRESLPLTRQGKCFADNTFCLLSGSVRMTGHPLESAAGIKSRLGTKIGLPAERKS